MRGNRPRLDDGLAGREKSKKLIILAPPLGNEIRYVSNVLSQESDYSTVEQTVEQTFSSLQTGLAA